MSDLATLVGEDAEHLWNSLKYHKLYYDKDGHVYGIVGAMVEDDMTMLYTMARNNSKFSFSMIKDIFSLYYSMNITLIVDTESRFDSIAKSLTPLGFKFFYVTSESGHEFMYAIHNKEER